MKIAYVTSPFLADCDLPLLRALRTAGHEVVCFFLISPASSRATVINLPALYPRGGLVPARDYPSLARLKSYLPLSQILIVNMPKAHDWCPSSLRAVWETFRYIRGHGFDIVHFTSPLRYGCFLLYCLPNKMVMTMHDPLPHSSDTGLMNGFLRRAAFTRIKNFIILSESLREQFVGTYHLEKKLVRTTGLGVYDVLKLAGEEDAGVTGDYILFAGSVNPHKGIKYLCGAMGEIHEKHPGLGLVIAGRGKFDFDIDAYTSSLPVTVINRFVTDGELAGLIRRAKTVVCPYVDATQSGVVMSCFALSKPVIATSVGALPDSIVHGRHGLLVPPRDSHAIASAVDGMLAPGVLETMAANIESDFLEGDRSWDSIARKTLDVYKEVTGR